MANVKSWHVRAFHYFQRKLLPCEGRSHIIALDVGISTIARIVEIPIFIWPGCRGNLRFS